MFHYKWYLKDGYPAKDVEKHNKKVFSCFSCGGGSTMGYKLAGYEVIGNNEIDPRMMKCYKENHHPKYNFLCDIRDLINKNDLPNDLYNLDILDGSPPCSVFSVAGLREDGWNKEKVFREGQKKQKLDDLFFYFIELVRKLQPKIIISENVTGLIKGNAKGYVKEIIQKFDKIGYITQIFLLNGATMGLPQARERCFFISQRKDIFKNTVQLNFNENPILFKEICDYEDKSKNLSELEFNLWKNIKPYDTCIADVNKRIRNKNSGFTIAIWQENKIIPTIISNSIAILGNLPRKPNKKELCLAGSFPLDYNFLNENPKYIIGMSVPPLMMAKISYEVYKQVLKYE